MPNMPINFLGELIYAGCGAIPVHKNGMKEPLAAVYPKSLIKLAEESLRSGSLKMQKFTTQAIEEGFLKRDLLKIQRYRSLKISIIRNFKIRMKNHSKNIKIIKHREGQSKSTDDFVAIEEPLEIRIENKSIAIVMRTRA